VAPCTSSTFRRRLLLTGVAILAIPTALRAEQPLSSLLSSGQIVRATHEGTVITPASSIVRAEDKGIRAHTNVEIFIPKGRIHVNDASPSGKYETPASLACVYGATTKVTGCNPETLTTVATGGSKVIAIVDAYDDPNAAADLSVYSSHYGLPAITGSNFSVVYASGTKPAKDSTGGWELEESLDLDMAHALAPNAKIILVEASSSSTTALLQAETVAANLVAQGGGGEVSNSWGGSESSNEESYESTFVKSGVVFFASAGDSPGVEFPSVLSNVVGVGGTTINRSNTGAYTSETSWADSGGGKSKYVTRPSYQSVVSGVVGTKRGDPDIGLDANPSSGAWVYDTVAYEGSVLDWVVVGGTSLASPASAALVNHAASFNTSSVAELTEMYGQYGNVADFTDITSGTCSNGGEKKAVAGYDFCTGIGSLLGAGGK
jgi:kumamolisin